MCDVRMKEMHVEQALNKHRHILFKLVLAYSSSSNVYLMFHKGADRFDWHLCASAATHTQIFHAKLGRPQQDFIPWAQAFVAKWLLRKLSGPAYADCDVCGDLTARASDGSFKWQTSGVSSLQHLF